jgi:hypothetical protein
MEQIGAGEPRLITGDLHDGAAHRVHRWQPALERQRHTRSLTMPTMLARPPRSDHRIALPTGCRSMVLTALDTLIRICEETGMT